MILFRIMPVILVLILVISPISAERVFFTDGTTYNSSLSKEDIVSRFEQYSDTGPIIVFHDLICESCKNAMEYLGEYEEMYPDVPIVYYDLHGNTTNKLLFEDYMQRYHQKNLLAPSVFIGPAGIEGNESIKKVFEPFSLLYERFKQE